MLLYPCTSSPDGFNFKRLEGERNILEPASRQQGHPSLANASFVGTLLFYLPSSPIPAAFGGLLNLELTKDLRRLLVRFNPIDISNSRKDSIAY